MPVALLISCSDRVEEAQLDLLLRLSVLEYSRLPPSFLIVADALAPTVTSIELDMLDSKLFFCEPPAVSLQFRSKVWALPPKLRTVRVLRMSLTGSLPEP